MVASGLEGHDFRSFCFAGRAIAEERGNLQSATQLKSADEHVLVLEIERQDSSLIDKRGLLEWKHAYKHVISQFQ